MVVGRRTFSIVSTRVRRIKFCVTCTPAFHGAKTVTRPFSAPLGLNDLRQAEIKVSRGARSLVAPVHSSNRFDDVRCCAVSTRYVPGCNSRLTFRIVRSLVHKIRRSFIASKPESIAPIVAQLDANVVRGLNCYRSFDKPYEAPAPS